MDLELVDQQIGLIAEKEVVTIDLGETIGFALLKMIKNRFRRLPVIENGILAGIISATDIFSAFVSDESLEFVELQIDDWITEDVVRMGYTDSLKNTLEEMYRQKVNCVPISQDYDLTGIFANKDVLLLHNLWDEVDDQNIRENEGLGLQITEHMFIDENASITQATEQLDKSPFNHLIVRGEGNSEYLGAISTYRILRSLVTHLIFGQKEIERLDEISIKSVVKDPLLRKSIPTSVYQIRIG